MSSLISIVYNGEVVDETNIQEYNLNDILDAVEERIAQLQNRNYASKEAQLLMDWESKIVARLYGGR